MKTVLVIDDDISLGETLVEMLELLGYNPTFCNTYEGAAERLDNGEAFDVVLSDYSIGEKTGLDLLEYARTKPQCADTLLVIASGYDSHSLEINPARLEGIQWLTKPYAVATLTQTLG